MNERVIVILQTITGVGAEDITLDLELFEEGFLDSFGSLQLLVALSQEFGVDLDVSEISRDQIATLNRIVETIKEKGAV